MPYSIRSSATAGAKCAGGAWQRSSLFASAYAGTTAPPNRHLSATPSFMLATLCCGSVTRTIVPPPLGPEVGERAAGRSTFV